MKRNVHHDSFSELYRSGKHTNTEIARILGVTVATIGNWARCEGLPPRKRGRPPVAEPSSSHRMILELLRNYQPVDVASRLGVSRQYVHQVRLRWGQSSSVEISASKPPVSVPSDTPRWEIKSQIISFRITQSEFLELGRLAIAHGNSPNDVARHLVLLYIGQAQPESENTLECQGGVQRNGGRAAGVIIGQGTQGSMSET
jgi:hypothetical protein